MSEHCASPKGQRVDPGQRALQPPPPSWEVPSSDSRMRGHIRTAPRHGDSWQEKMGPRPTGLCG